MSQDTNGYYQKFRVIDNRTGEEVTEPTFTLKLLSDPFARHAVLTYAQDIAEQNPQLLQDLNDHFDRWEKMGVLSAPP